MLKYSDVILQPLKDHKFKVVKPFTYKCATVTDGFTTDGASVPRVFWSIFPPNRTDYLPCAVVHDFLCDKGEYRKADNCFLSCLKHLGVGKFTTYTMYYAVRLYHLIKYRR